MNIIVALLYSLSFLFISQLVGYPLLMAIVTLTSKPRRKDYSFQPYVSIIIPTHNEEKVIKRRITNLFDLDYARHRYEMIVVDSHSADSTTQIVKDVIREHQKHRPSLKVVMEDQRRGKASAINLGIRHAVGEIALVTDANSVFDKNVLKEIVPHFKDPSVGAVTGRYLVLNPDRSLTASESSYWEIEHIKFLGESSLGFTSTLIGTISAWRKDQVTLTQDTASEDLDMCIAIRRKGFKVEYEPNALAYELAATTVADQVKQRRRTSLGTIQNIFKHLPYFIPPRDLYSFLIFTFHKTLAMLSPFIIVAILISYILTSNVEIIVTHLGLTSSLFVGMLVALMFVKSALFKGEQAKCRFSISSIPRIIYYVLLNEYVILLAWKSFALRTDSTLWERAETTRQQPQTDRSLPQSARKLR